MWCCHGPDSEVPPHSLERLVQDGVNDEMCPRVALRRYYRSLRRLKKRWLIRKVTSAMICFAKLTRLMQLWEIELQKSERN